MIKSKRLQTRAKAHENLWIGSTSESYPPLRPSNMITNHISPLIAFGEPFIPHSTLHFIDKLMLKFLKRSATN